MFWVLFCTVHLTVSSYHVTYAFQSESTLYSCLYSCLSVCLRTKWFWVRVQLQSLKLLDYFTNNIIIDFIIKGALFSCPPQNRQKHNQHFRSIARISYKYLKISLKCVDDVAMTLMAPHWHPNDVIQKN